MAKHPKTNQDGSRTRGKATKNKAPSSRKSTEAPRSPVEDVVATRMLRDTTVREKVYLQNRVLLVVSVALCLSIIANVMLALREPDIQYFATDTNGSLLPLTSLDQPVQSVNEVLSWSTDAITKAYTFSFANYRQQLQDARDAFTTEGWSGFQTALEESGNLRTVIANRFVTTAVPRGAPVVVSEGYLNGRYAWKIEVPILVTYESANKSTTQDLIVQAVIVRRPELEHPKGIGIAQIIAQ
ncbi:type IVB secretion system apparatus protein IcmL/DotI [Salipiger mucosus]|uniref:IcmL (DotI) protein n=1 Tax=Salipiger mucosus DSM 16094 TaxID=1123237 RepID=S9SBA1_9RHOB|nr:type IVB secretion system apparatus protein IcmL/DotI [Salipiger mucosus]EPX83504.1 IcmL (DotI) protein [Salipiger mucosus DSM 16094]